MTQKKSLLCLLTLTLLFTIPLQSVYAQNLESLSDYSIQLAISPSHIEEGPSDHPIGYLYVLSKNGVPITSSNDVSISLSSDDPLIASVPEKIILKANEEYASFDITTGDLIGNTIITATLNSKTTFQEIQVGNTETHLPDDLILELNLPTNEMHVNTEMPFSVYLRTSDGYVVRAPFDINVNLEYEKTLAIPNSDVLTIKKGDYYAWGTLETNEKVGNTFLRAIQNESNLDTAKSIEISSTLPASLEIDIFHPIHKKWVEFGGAGMFRPEVTIPIFGKHIPVLAWGPGFDRIIMDYYGIKDLREMYENDIKKLREKKVWIK